MRGNIICATGRFFLASLYSKLSEHPDLELTTYSAFLQRSPKDIVRLPHLVAGSWVYGTCSTWIGDKDKNRAWDMLGYAKRCFDPAVASGRLTESDFVAVKQQLAVCEGSDWFWWFGDYNPGDTVSEFEMVEYP